ncbi:MAG TPA: nicotinate-nucleotide adenylyltransferase [Gemmataceae bacterium]|nr:nicotinate-nucleotide adenylyltransferase [Gemmataceae bacterium]
MRIGIFGGTFDPVHLGHLILAEQCREQARLDQVLFVLAARPPHKQERQLTPFAQRVEMLALACAGQPAFRIEEMEKDRPGPSFTVETVQQIHSRHPEAELSLVLGADTLHDLPQWYEPARIVQLAELLIVPRSDWMMLSAEELRKSLSLPADVPLRIQQVSVPAIGISSRDLRRRAAEGLSLRFLVPRAVEVFIQEKRLYAKN